MPPGLISRRIYEVSAKDRDNQDAARPTISVVICTRDRPASLLDTLRSLRTQTLKPDELLILDDGNLSECDRERIEIAAAEAASHWRIIPTGGRGLTASRNLAARSAKGDILLFLDDDVTCEPGVIVEITRLMCDPLVSGVTATIIEPAFRARGARLFQWGYRVAGWWSIGPRGTPAGPRPTTLNDSAIAKRARWLSGAAMAIRRSVVVANPFDESLAEYALGEDREMGYRLARTHWLLESKRARVVHRRDGGGRADPYRLGFMTARNYAYILRKTCDLNAIDAVLIAWSFFMLSMMQAACAALGGRSHWHELRGLAAGVRSIVREWNHKNRLLKQWKSARPQTVTNESPHGTVHSRSHWQTSCPWHTDGQSRAVLSPVVQPVLDTLTLSLKEEGTKTNRRDDTPTLIECPQILTEQRALNVLFVTNRLTHGGAERMLLTLVKRLPPLGITPTIACLQDAGPLAVECKSVGIVVHDGLLQHKTDVAVILRLRQIIEAAAIDVVIVAHSGGDRMFWPTLAAKTCEIPVVVWSHWFPRAGVAHIERPNRALYRLIDGFVALGEAHKSALVRHEHVPAGRISIIRNAIELDRFAEPAPRELFRAAIGLRPDEIGVGIIANLRPEKRHDVFLRAAALLAPLSNLRFFIIGDGPGRSDVERQIQDHGLNVPTLRMLGVRNNTPELLRALDIACLCSDVECQPVVMLEAAAAGCAFIGPEAGCVSEFLTHRETGWLVKPSDAVGLADAISVLSTDGALRRRLTDAAARRVREQCDAERMAEQFAELFRGVVDRRVWSGLAETPKFRPIAAMLR